MVNVESSSRPTLCRTEETSKVRRPKPNCNTERTTAQLPTAQSPRKSSSGTTTGTYDRSSNKATKPPSHQATKPPGNHTAKERSSEAPNDEQQRSSEAPKLRTTTKLRSSEQQRSSEAPKLRTANGERRTNDERRTTNDERRTTNDERRTTNDERRTTNDER